MEKINALEALAALAQETRLEIFRRLVEVGRRGLPAGEIGDDLRLSSATLSFHLKELRRARLVRPQRNGRHIIYSADFETMNGLIAYLTEHCCRDQGQTGSTVYLTEPACFVNDKRSAARTSGGIRTKR